MTFSDPIKNQIMEDTEVRKAFIPFVREALNELPDGQDKDYYESYLEAKFDFMLSLAQSY